MGILDRWQRKKRVWLRGLQDCQSGKPTSIFRKKKRLFGLAFDFAANRC